VVLAAILLLTLGGMLAYSKYSEQQYLRRLQAEIARLQPLADKARALDQQIDKTRARTQLLDKFRTQTRYDLDSLNELTRLIEPPAWTNNIELTRDSLRVMGEGPAAPPLVTVLESSPYFEGVTLLAAQAVPAGESFQIQGKREARK